jgi:G3E family GTPase
VKQNDPIPVVVLTGFLGSGKTTLLKHWLHTGELATLRTGLVVNDFGPVNVDSLLLSNPALPLEQLSGGCVCCADELDLPTPITRLLDERRCACLVLETSGLAEPAATLDMLTDAELFPRARLHAVVTVVDGEMMARPGMDGIEPGLRDRQIRFANWVLLSKCDFITEVEINKVKEQVRKLNSNARICPLPPSLSTIFGGPAAEFRVNSTGLRKRGKTSTEHRHQAFQTVGFEFVEAADRAGFTRFLDDLDPHQVVRAKGFVHFHDEPRKLYVFQYVAGRHCFVPFTGSEPQPRPVAVLIGPGLDADDCFKRIITAFTGTRRKSRRGAHGQTNETSTR